MQKVKKPFYKKTWFLILVGLVIIGKLFGGSGDTDKPTAIKAPVKVEAENKEKPKAEVPKKEEPKVEEVIQTEFVLGDVISYKDFDLTIENQREVSSMVGGESYIIIDITIVAKKDNFSFFGDIQGVTDDNEVVGDTIAFVKDDLGDPIMTAWTKTLNSGQKAKGYIAFDRPIAKLEIRGSMFKNEAITINLN